MPLLGFFDVEPMLAERQSPFTPAGRRSPERQEAPSLGDGPQALPTDDGWQALSVADRRQSPAAIRVRRGVGRLLREMGFAVVPEVILASGRRADLVALGNGGEVVIVEIKSCLADYRTDGKWPDYRPFCDRFYFATLPEVGDIFPVAEGLIVTDGYDAEILREAQVARMAATARRAMTIRLAQTAGRRLHELEDPSPRVVVPV